MPLACPACGAADQEVGKYCENCGFFIADAASPATAATGSDVPAAPDGITQPTVPVPDAGAGAGAGAIGAAPDVSAATVGGAQFAVVKGGQANPAEGFTINTPGDFLVGRVDAETGNQVDIDLRQWVQPLEIQGVKQYLVHRKQCFVGLTPEGLVTIRGIPGAEHDTMVKPVAQTVFTPLQDFATLRPARPDLSFELQPGDRIYMGDPDALQYFLTGDSTAEGSYVVFELLKVPGS